MKMSKNVDQMGIRSGADKNLPQPCVAENIRTLRTGQRLRSFRRLLRFYGPVFHQNLIPAFQDAIIREPQPPFAIISLGA